MCTDQTAADNPATGRAASEPFAYRILLGGAATRWPCNSPATHPTRPTACDDFDEYVDGRWKADTDLPASRARAGSFDTLSQSNDRLLKAALEALVADPARQTGPGLKLLAAYYRSGRLVSAAAGG